MQSMLEPLDSVVNAAAILAVGALLTGALWGVVSADPKRKVGVKAFVRAFSKFVAAMLVATIIYYLPSSTIFDSLGWLANNPSKVASAPVYFLAGAMLFKIIKRAWA